MPRILNIGSINLDEVFSVPHFAAPGETLSCVSYERFIGGKGNNQSIALARAGAEVYHAGKIGADGAAAVVLMSSAGADVSRVVVGNEATGRAIIQVDASGQNCILLYGGANQSISESDIDGYLSGWSAGDSVLFQNETSSLSYAITRAKELGLRICLNPSPVNEQVLLAPLQLVDCFILNEIEGCALAGISGKNIVSGVPVDSGNILSGLRARFPRADIVLTLGSAGSRYSGADGTELAMPATHDIPLDTTAAGDTYTGYFIAAVLRGEAPETAMREAAAAAGICITRKGAVPSIPCREEVLFRLESLPPRVV